jgi:uncharacterized protein
MVSFPASGVEAFWWLPVLVAFAISSLTSLGGLSGAFLLLPFQVSVLGFTGPAVTSTNLLFNIVATPAGVIAILREKRMVWPLAIVLSIGTLVGVFVGALARIHLLPDPRGFKLFVAMVLVYIASRLLHSALQKTMKISTANNKSFTVTNSSLTLKHVKFTFHGEDFWLSTLSLFLLSTVVGVVGTIYGIGGGAIIAPFLVAVFRIPVYAVAGPAFFSTFVSSVGGVLAYSILEWAGVSAGLKVQPDWFLGSLLGIGGAIGIYLGSRMQRFVPARLIKLVIFAGVSFVVVKYVLEFFQG